MRTLLVTVCVVGIVDAMLYAVLIPLLPEITNSLNLGKSAAGFLVAAYALGVLSGVIPAGLVTIRLGAKVAVILGMTLLAAASLIFASAEGLDALITARFLQGVSSAISWTGGIAWLLSAAPRERRGQVLGVALGAGIFGAVFGPVLGALAVLTSRVAVFMGVALLTAATALWSVHLEYAHVPIPAPGSLKRAGRHRTFLAGLGMMIVPSFLIGTIVVLGPLHLSSRGWGAAAIGALWLITAFLQSSLSPVVGRLGDQRGAMSPVVFLLAVGIPLSVALALVGQPIVYAVLLVAAACAYSGLYAPAFTLIANGAEDSGLPQGLAFAAMNAAWAIGAVLGPSAGGAIAQATGDRVPLMLSASICAVTLIYARHRSRKSDKIHAIT